MIGVSMLLTIALCAIGFTVLYTALDAFTSDFISRTDETPTIEAQVAAPNTDNPDANTAADPTAPPVEATTAPEPAQAQAPEPTATVAPTREADDAEFDPDFQIASDVTINLREGPSTATSILEGLPPATPLEYLDEDAPTDTPSDGERWMKFETETGLVGWVREIDVTAYEP
jgi:hypothetical protein